MAREEVTKRRKFLAGVRAVLLIARTMPAAKAVAYENGSIQGCISRQVVGWNKDRERIAKLERAEAERQRLAEDRAALPGSPNRKRRKPLLLILALNEGHVEGMNN